MTATMQEVGEVRLISLSQLQADPDWERTNQGSLDEASLRELADSIKERGILEPLRVYELGEDRYLLNSGHRRAIAARSLKMAAVPCYVLSRSQERVDEHANRLVSNLQRSDITQIEKARSLRLILDSRPMTRLELGRLVGLHIQTISALLRLLDLPEKIQTMLNSRQLNIDHAPTLLRIHDEKLQLEAAEWAIQMQASVEDLIKHIDFEIHVAPYFTDGRVRVLSPIPVKTPEWIEAPPAPIRSEYQRTEPTINENRAVAVVNHKKIVEQRAVVANSLLDGLPRLELLRLSVFAALDNAKHIQNVPVMARLIAYSDTEQELVDYLTQIMRSEITLDEEARHVEASPRALGWLREKLTTDVQIEAALAAEGLISTRGRLAPDQQAGEDNQDVALSA